MSYTTTQLLGLSAGGTILYFRPGAVHVSQTKTEKNQRTTVTESGRAVTVTVSPNQVEQIELVFSDLKATDDVQGGITLRGSESLLTWIKETLNYRGAALSYKPKGIGSDSFSTGWRYWDSSVVSQEQGLDRFSLKMTLRRVVAP